jgi:phosphate transport system protein
MSIRATFDQELQDLSANVLRLGSMVDAAISLSIQALKERGQELAQQIITDDEKINELRFKIEEDCVSLIARQQPAARDLRLIVAAMNIVLDLERMGDHAAGIATIVLRMGDEPLLKPLIDLPRMAQISQDMLRQSLDALISDNPDEARAITQIDDEVDMLYNQIFRELVSYNAGHVSALLRPQRGACRRPGDQHLRTCHFCVDRSDGGDLLSPRPEPLITPVLRQTQSHLRSTQRAAGRGRGWVSSCRHLSDAS